MIKFKERKPLRRAAGSVLVETALVLMTLVTLLAFLTLLGRYFWYYNVAQKAAFDGARFLATATQVEMRTLKSGAREPVVAALARQIVLEELADIEPYLSMVSVDVHCDFRTCTNSVPLTVRVSISLSMQDDVFRFFTSKLTLQEGMPILADVTVNYAGK